MASDPVEEWTFDRSWRFVTSSNVEAIRYLYDEQILEVEFQYNRYYQYYNVPVDVAKAMYRSNSPGVFVNDVLVDYSFTNLPALS